jgi:hypothetical protein
MRFGYSPGWVDRSPTGLSPTAEWIMSSGLMPQYREYLRKRLEWIRKSPLAQPTPTLLPSFGYPPTLVAPPSPEEELRSLEEYRKYLEEEARRVEERIEELKKLRGGKPSA